MSSLPNLLWVDIETTGLDETMEVPLELGVVVTNAELEVLEERSWVMGQTLVLNDLSDWVLQTHAGNGLLLEVARSTHTVESVDVQLESLLTRAHLWPTLGETPPLCGSSVSFDRAWLKEWFPRAYKRIHYRSIDVSSIKELMQRWMPGEAVSNKETSAHRSLPDIYDSIDELKHYRSVLNWA